MRKLTVASPSANCFTRRAILETLAAAALTACAGHTVITSSDPQEPGSDGGSNDDASADDASTGDSSTTQCPSATSAGPVESYPQGSWKANGAYIIGHDASGLFAFSTTCTHQGCTINPPSSTTGATSCPCHGARFDGNGAVVAGPARSPLPHFALSVCEGMVYVDTKATVAATTRTPAA